LSRSPSPDRALDNKRRAGLVQNVTNHVLAVLGWDGGDQALRVWLPIRIAATRDNHPLLTALAIDDVVNAKS